MKSKFSLSFGIALIFVGVLNIFFKTDNMILFGISSSALVFSFINLIFIKYKSEKLELLYIFPFIILLSFFCYSRTFLEYDFMKKIINSSVSNILTFLSFGILFVAEYMNSVNDSKKEIARHLELVHENYEFIMLILNKLVEYKKSISKNKKLDTTETDKYMDKIQQICKEKFRKGLIESELLNSKNEKFSLDEFGDAFNKYSEYINVEKIMKDVEKRRDRKKMASHKKKD